MKELEAELPYYLTLKYGKTFYKVNKSNAKDLYFDSHCNFDLIHHFLPFYSQYTFDEILNWNNEYFSYIDKQLNDFYIEDISLDNLLDYSFLLISISKVYTNDKNNYIIYLNNLKKYITKYGYFLFYGLIDIFDGIQYGLPYMFNIVYNNISDFDFYKNNKRVITIKKMIPDLDKCGLVPLFLRFGYDDLLNEILFIFKNSLRIEKIFGSINIMNQLGLRFSLIDDPKHLNEQRTFRYNLINNYLKDHNSKILL